MPRTAILLLILFSIPAPAAERPPYKTFYLGLNPKMKYAVLEDMLSGSGNIYWVNEDSVLVRDDEVTLKNIEEFLSKRDVALKDQVRISLRRSSQGKDRNLNSDIGVKYDSRRGASVTWKGGIEDRSTLDSNQSSIMVVSGGTAEIRLQKTAATLESLRRRFLAESAGMVSTDGVFLRIKPVIAGRLVQLDIETWYVAQLKGRKKTAFSTGELRSSVVLRPGSWLDLGGSSRKLSEKDRRNAVLGIENRDSDESLDFSVMAEIITLQEPPEPEQDDR